MSEYNRVKIADCQYPKDSVVVSWEDKCTDGLPLGLTVVERGRVCNATLDEKGLDKLIETLITIKTGLNSE